MNKPSLLVISHTEHFLDCDGRVRGWIPTVRELDFLSNTFEKIIHIATLHSTLAPKSTTPYSSDNIEFRPIKPFGGEGLSGKLSILRVLPELIGEIKTTLKEVDFFQFRAPTSIGLFVIPYLTFLSNSKGWYKYAGNWMQPNMPLSYKFQKTMLRLQKRKVTINGVWSDQQKNLISFENPCLDINELPINKEKGIRNRPSATKFVGCFVGRLDEAKGVHRIVDVLNRDIGFKTFDEFHFVGEGEEMNFFRDKLKNSEVQVYFHGFLDRKSTFQIYSKSHIMLLPSNSEGFPKVIAEAASFGCVPMVSDVSCIGQYVTKENGYLWPIEEISFSEWFEQQNINAKEITIRMERILKVAEKFTFQYFLEKLKKEVLK